MKKRIVALMMSCVLVGSMLTGCGSDSASSDTIKLAYAGPLTGDCSQDGTDARDGAKLAVDVLNEAGGINGKTVELVEYDDKGDPKEAATVASQICQDSSIVATVGHYNSSCTLAGAPIYEKNGLPIIAIGSSANSVSDAGDYIFRDVNSDDASAYDCANWAVNDMGIKKLAVMYENDDYGVGLADSFVKYAEEFGAEIVSNDAYLLGETKDFTSILTKIGQTDAEMIFIGGLYNETAMIMKQEQQIGMSLPCIGTDSLYSAGVIELGGDAVEGMYCISGFTLETEDADIQEFIDKFNKKYGKNPGTFAANGYDAVMLFAEAIKAGDGTRTSIKDNLYNISGYKGIAGEVTYDENGDVHKQYIRLVIKDGEFKLTE